jgi:hypothetical protein
MKTNFNKMILVFSLVITFISCETNDDPVITNTSVSIETTNENAEKTYTTIKINGTVSSDGGSSIINRGICWNTEPNPTIENNSIIENNNNFSSTINNLLANTSYYFRTFATNELGTSYSEQQIISTLSLNNTSWKFTTIYPNQNNFEIFSKIDFLDDNTTKFDEMDLPGQCPGCFITFGTWSLEGNNLTYIWEGSDSTISTYVYTGILNGMDISGTYTHSSEPNGTWNAIEL